MDKLQILTVAFNSNYSLLDYDDERWLTLVNNKVVVGYLLKNRGSSNLPLPTLNLYVIKADSLSDLTKIISLTTLKSIYQQWVESLIEDPKPYMFRNPPLEEWLETKQNWVKKITNQLAQSYGMSYDDCRSLIYNSILNCYNKGNIYLGNLHYLTVVVHNAVKLEHRYMLNRLHGGHPDAIHLDATPSDFNAALDDSISSLHEIVGGPTDADREEARLNEIADDMMEDLRKDFSEREIDQIINTPGFLPMPLYRKLLKWRKTHKLEDYL